MYILFSPSKKQLPQKVIKATQPKFQDKADLLYQKVAGVSRKDLAKHFKLSDKVSEEVYKNYLDKDAWGNALCSYSGTSFQRLDVSNYSTEDWSFAQKHLRILSGMYGILKPKDLIRAHRLDLLDNIDWMQLDTNLYGYWRDVVNKELQNVDVLLNLASHEYIKILAPENRKKLIDVQFKVCKKGSCKSVSVFSKQQRGSLLDYIIKNKITNFKDIESYSSDGFVFDIDASDKSIFVFTKSS